MSTLSEALDFDHVIEVLDDGTWRNAPSSLYAPEAYDVDNNETTLGDWQLPLSGLTGQHGYNGPWLHNSEVIAGGVESVIRVRPGYWVAIYGQHSCSDDLHPHYADVPENAPRPNANYPESHDDCETFIEGWTVAYRQVSK